MKISGTVSDAKKQPLSGYRVAAFHGDVNLKKERLLARGRTGKDGKYSFPVNLARYPHGVNPRLVILGARSAELWSGPTQYNIKTDLIIDATITDAQLGVSEYQRLTDAIAPSLQGLSLSDLDPTQVTYLIGRAGVDPAQLRLLVTAAQLNEQHNDVSVEAFYGLLRQGLPNTISGLVALTDRDWRAALERAAHAYVIAQLSRPRTSAILAALNKQKAAEMLRPSARSTAAGRAAFAAVALKSENKQQKVAELAARHNGINDEFWRALERDRTLKADAESLKSHAAIAEMVGNDPAILREVAAHLERRGEKVTPVALTKIDHEQLGQIIEKATRPAAENPFGVPDKKYREAFARSLADDVTRTVAARFPTQLVCEELSGTPGDTYFGKYKNSLSKFFEHNGDVDLRESLYPVFRPQDGSDPFRRTPDKDVVTERLGTLARLYRALPAVESGAMAKMSLLAEKGFDSSFAISRTSKAQFLHTVDPRKREQPYWSDVHDRAAAMRDIALLKGAELLHTFRQPLPVITQVSSPTQAGAAEWRTLFGSLDLCTCEACASITSPAAYLADILNFLSTDVAPGGSTTSPYDVLIARRPDIEHILLNCDNTNRELPYIDLVNELLEDEVVRQSGKEIVWRPHRHVTLSIPEATLVDASHDDAAAIVAKASLVKGLNDPLSHYDFSGDIHVSKTLQSQKRSWWHLFEHGWLVELSPTKKDRTFVVDYISRQTYGTKAELAANPAFRNPEATQTLEGANYPLSLPAGLPLLETRLFLEHLKVPRERLLKLVAPGDLDRWAVEYLGLSWAEACLITNTPRDGQVVGPAEKWGFDGTIVRRADALVDPADTTKLLTGMHWTEALSRVDVLIARAGITYIELLDLLDTYFINPVSDDGSRRISIQSDDKSDPATCDLSKLKIMGKLGWPRNLGTSYKAAALPANRTEIGDADDFFDRLVRFLRLKRRTGWTSRELDLAVRAVGLNFLGQAELSLLASIKWTKDTLRLAHDQACALIGGIDTKRYMDHAADGQPMLPSQYERLFLNREVTNPADRRFALNAARKELADPTLHVESGAATLAAAFEISISDVLLLASKLNIDFLSVKALSLMYRRVLLARALKLGVQQIVWLEELNGSLDPAAEVVPFAKRVTRLLKSGVSANDAWFLLRKTETTTAYLMPRDEEIKQTLGSLRDELQTIEREHESPDPIDPDAELLRKRLAELDWGEPLIDDLLSVVADTKVFKVHLEPLPEALRKLMSPDPDEPAGVELAANASVPDMDKISDLVVADTANGRLLARHQLTREDRRRLLCSNGGAASFRKAVEQLCVAGRLSYDDQSKTLSCRGLLPEASLGALSSLPQAATKALDGLFDQQQQLLRQKLRFCTLPIYEVPLDVATSLSFSESVRPYVYYDSAAKKVVVYGRLTDAEADELAESASPGLPQAKKQQLKDGLPILAKFTTAPAGQRPTEVNQNELADLLADVAAVKTIFDPEFEATATARKRPATTAEISALLLERLTPHAREVLQTKAIVSALSDSFGLAPDITQHLIQKEPTIRSAVAATPPIRVVEAFQGLTASDERAPVDLEIHKGLYEDYRRLSKIALLFQRLKLEFLQLPWVFEYALSGKWLTAASLTDGDAAGEDLKTLESLVRLFTASRRAPYTPQWIDEALHLANGSAVGDLLKYIAKRTAWRLSDLTAVSKAQGISAPAPPTNTPLAEQMNGQAFEDLLDAMTAIGQIGATEKQALQLVDQDLEDDDAVLAKSLAKSKHDREHWLTVVKPINDRLREARRSALVDYLVTRPRRDETDQPLWHDANSLYAYLLVDVQMGDCMTTTRIRLALSSVQLFVQRCLMNLESTVTVNSDAALRKHWDEWDSWRKLYRVWEANRKVFLYPEDWIEPELRDDKTPFFKELENELMQHEVTSETAEAAFLNYLHKLDGVAKLEVMGMFIEEENVAGTDSSPDKSKKNIRYLHVVARTFGEPHQWFYRNLKATGEWHEGLWSPWEKIDADLAGDHILPVVWNKHLYVFWAIFDKKADKPGKDEINDKDHPHEARQRWYIRFAWSEYRNGKWSPKRVSSTSLRTPSAEFDGRTIDEADFSFKTKILESGIEIDCYGLFIDTVVSEEPGGETVPPTPKEGHRLAPPETGPPRTANCSIRFVDQNRNFATNIDVFIYQGDTKLLTLDTKNGGYVDLWNHFGGTESWRKTQIEIWTRQKLFVIQPLQWTPWDWYYDRREGDFHQIEPLFTQVELVDNEPTASEPPSGPTSSRSPGLIGTAPPLPTKLGHFDFQICRGDPTPSEVDSASSLPPEVIPLLDANSTLNAMMYVENLGSAEFLDRMLRTTSTDRYHVLVPHQYVAPDTEQPFFFQDNTRVYFVTRPESPQPTGFAKSARTPAANWLEKFFRGHRFDVFYHPCVCNFITEVQRKGIKELLTLQSQSADDKGAAFKSAYQPDATKVQLSQVDRYGNAVAVSREHVDFDVSGAYSAYNWELFFHAPLLIASKLTTNQRFQEARDWLHFVFDPTTRPGAFSPAQQLKPTQRFWNVRPFWEAEGRGVQSINDLLKASGALMEQYSEWREHPFKPFVVARLRQTAFMQSVVMRYLDNLMAWGDQEFARFTMESTNEATLLYVLAADILGKAPEKIPPPARPALQTSLSMQRQAQTQPAGESLSTWQNFSDLMVEIEAYIAPATVPDGIGTNSSLGRMWAFCLPGNEKLLTYWSQVADRLFKLRHCRDIEGIERKIPLWDPPIDPGLLVRAAAAGVDLASVLDDINASLPNYRFTALLQKAVELCNEVRNFGAALLSAIEKKEGEALALLRSQHEISVLTAMKTVREKQVSESTAQHEAAKKSRIAVEERRNHYRDIAQLIPGESTGLTLSGLALTQEAVAAGSDAIAAIAAIVPQYSAGTSGFYSSPVVVAAYGGEQLSRAASASASLARSTAGIMTGMSSMSHTVAGFQRRWDEWKLQETLANKELDQIDKQIVAANLREEIAQAELDSHEEQIENAKTVEDYLKSKFTNQELYGWMQSQSASTYFQAYRLAYDVAKKAERAFRHELGLKNSNYVQFGYWDSLKKGLLSGEKLGQDLRRMEVAYLDQNKREYEIIKHVSLLQLDPLGLVALRELGRCEFSVPEVLFDLDYAGHYMRRIKSVSVTIPCVVGPYTSVPCTVTLLKSTVRHAASAAGDYDRDLQNDDGRFTDMFSSIQSVATSSGQADSGLFETNLRDERFLPFEGCGVISTWRLELPSSFKSFDYDSISDVILHFRYTAREGGEGLKAAAVDGLKDAVNAVVANDNGNGLSRLFSFKHEFPSEWYQLGNATAANNEQTIALAKNRFPFMLQTRKLTIKRLTVLGLLKPTQDQQSTSALKGGKLKPPGAAEIPFDDSERIQRLERIVSPVNVPIEDKETAAQWKFSVKKSSFDRLDDILFLCQYIVGNEEN